MSNRPMTGFSAGSEEASYDDLVRKFAWDVPERLNMGKATSDAWAQSEPDRVALIEWTGQSIGRRISFGELKDLSDRLAKGFRALGLELDRGLEVETGERAMGKRAAIILPQCLETVISHMAIYKCGAISVPLARLFQPDALQYRLQRAGCSLVVTNQDGLAKLVTIAEQLPDLKHVVIVDADESRLQTANRGQPWAILSLEEVMANNARDFEAADTGADDPALIIFTSGTTGPPKGALHGHRVLLGHVPTVITSHEFLPPQFPPPPGSPHENAIAWTPADWAWAGGLLNILMPCLYLGVPVVYGGLERFDPHKAFEILQAAKVTNAFIPPTALRLMKTVEDVANRYQLSLRTIVSGGESVGAETCHWANETLGIPVNEIYGQTECNLVLGSCAGLGLLREGAIGKQAPGHVVDVLDQSGNPCAPGIVGEVAIKRPDPVMFLEYWQDEKATKDKFVGDWMMTGDQCVRDEDGYFHFVGRDDDIINCAGYRIGPSEIEDCLVSHNKVRLAAAIGKPDQLRGEVVKAYVVLTEDAIESLKASAGNEAENQLREDIKAHVKARLSANIYPREIEFVDEIPLTTSGKVIRRHFREQARREAAGQ